jgi:hypothetical protein
MTAISLTFYAFSSLWMNTINSSNVRKIKSFLFKREMEKKGSVYEGTNDYDIGRSSNESF